MHEAKLQRQGSLFMDKFQISIRWFAVYPALSVTVVVSTEVNGVSTPDKAKLTDKQQPTLMDNWAASSSGHSCMGTDILYRRDREL